jgi:hypothetical protein
MWHGIIEHIKERRLKLWDFLPVLAREKSIPRRAARKYPSLLRKRRSEAFTRDTLVETTLPDHRYKIVHGTFLAEYSRLPGVWNTLPCVDPSLQSTK